MGESFTSSDFASSSAALRSRLKMLIFSIKISISLQLSSAIGSNALSLLGDKNKTPLTEFKSCSILSHS